MPRQHDSTRLKVMSAYRIQACLLAGEGESESKRQAGILHAHVVQEVRYAVNNVIKKLGKKYM